MRIFYVFGIWSKTTPKGIKLRNIVTLNITGVHSGFKKVSWRKSYYWKYAFGGEGGLGSTVFTRSLSDALYDYIKIKREGVIEGGGGYANIVFFVCVPVF